MKLRAYDTYGNQHLIINLGDDEISVDATSSRWSGAKIYINITLDTEYYDSHPDEHAEDPEFKRWSDLKDVEIVMEKKS